MARPSKNTVDYFPHQCIHNKTMYIIEQRYGNDGYAFWFKLLEILGSSPGHFVVYAEKTSADWEFLLAKTHQSCSFCTEMLDLLAKLDAIDRELWKFGVVWCQNFVDNVSELYKKRKTEIPKRPVSYIQNPTTTEVFGDNCGENPSTTDVSAEKTPQSKVKESKVKERKKYIKKKFTPPTLDEVSEYCKSRKNQISPKKFFDFYEASGWKDSKGNPVLNWKQKVITWEGRGITINQKTQPWKQPEYFEELDEVVNQARERGKK